MAVAMISTTRSRALVATRTRRDALELSSDMSFDEWASVGSRIARIHSGSTWALGDWLLFGECRFGVASRDARGFWFEEGTAEIQQLVVARHVLSA